MGMESELATLSDNIGERYRARSKDRNLSQKEREAAQVIVVAEAHLQDEQADKSLKKAEEGLKLFREAGDEVGVADIIRVTIHCLCSKDERREGNRIAKEELERIRAGTDRRGEGKMLLAIAEVNTDRRGHKNRMEAKGYAEEALKIFEKEGDRLLEAYTRMCLLNIAMKWRGDKKASCQEGLDHGVAARALLKACGDKRGEALALHGIAAVNMRAAINDLVLSGFPGGWTSAAADAARLFKEARCFKMVCFEKTCIAQWTLCINPRQARQLAKEAVMLCQEYKSRQESAALSILVQSHLAVKDASADFMRDEAQTAVQLAQEGVERFRGNGDRFGEAASLHSLVLSYKALGDRQEAMKHAASAADIYKEIGEKSGETSMLQVLSQMHLEEKEPEKALQVVQEVTELNMGLRENAIAQETLYEAYMQQGELSQALQTAEELVTLCSDKQDGKREAIARLMIANVHYTQQDFTQALLVAREAQVLLHDLGAWADEASALRIVAEAYLANNQIPEALKAGERSLRLLRGKNQSSDECSSLLVVAQIRLSMLSQDRMQMQRGSSVFAAALTDSMQAADDAVAFARKARLRPQEGQALIIAGQMQHSSLQTDASLKTAEEAMDIFLELGDQKQKANVMCLQADAHLTNGNANKALVIVNKALAIFQEHGDRRGEWVAMNILEQITGPQEEVQPTGGQDQWTPDQWAQWEEWQKQQQLAQGAGKGGQSKPPSQLQKAQETQRQSRAVTGDKLNLNNLNVDSVRNRLNEIVKATVGLDDNEEFDLDTPLMQVGITSRSAVELRNTLSAEVPGVDLPFTLIFDFPSVASISDMVLENLDVVG